MTELEINILCSKEYAETHNKVAKLKKEKGYKVSILEKEIQKDLNITYNEKTKMYESIFNTPKRK